MNYFQSQHHLGPSSVFFRLDSKFFREARDSWTKIQFDGAVLSVLDIKRSIMQHENLTGSSETFDLVLTNSQTGEEFREEGFLVPRNSSLVVRKIPSTVEASSRIRVPPETVTSGDGQTRDPIYGGGRIIGAPQEETDDSIVNFLAEREKEAASNANIPGIPNPREELAKASFGLAGYRYNQRFDPGAKPPPGYICHRCQQTGHFIRFCPTNDDPSYNFRRPKPATGIPRSFLKPVEAPTSGAGENAPRLLLPDATFAVAIPNQRQFIRSLADSGSVTELPSQTNKNSPPNTLANGGLVQSSSVPQQKINEAAPLRDELYCPLCRNPFVNAVMPSCCFATFCDVCIRMFLSASENPQCPICRSPECTVDVIKPNIGFQKAVDDYLETHPEKAPPILFEAIKKISEQQEKLAQIPSNSVPVSEINPEFVNPFSNSSNIAESKQYHRTINPKNTCFRCGEQGHYASTCTNEPNPNAYNPTRAAF